MPTNWWDYEPAGTYYARTRQSFEERARQAALNFMLSQQMRSRGYLPEVANLEPTEALPAPEKSKPSGGILGRIKDTLGDVTETVFQGAVDQPWDVLRPVANALEWEREHIAKPAAQAYIKGLDIAAAGAGAPLTAAIHHQSLDEAFAARMERIEQSTPGWMDTLQEELLTTVFSPSMWIGTPVAGKGLQAAQRGLRVALLEPLYGREAIKAAMAGGAAPSKSMQAFLDAYKALPEIDVLGMPDPAEAVRLARMNPSWTQAVRKRIGSGDRGAQLFERLGIRAFDDDWAILAAENLRGKDVGARTAQAWVTVMRQTAKSANLKLDEAGRLLDVPGQPLIRDVAQYLSLHPAITPDQANAIRLIAEPLQILRTLEKAGGIKTADRPAEIYFHAQAVSKPVQMQQLKITEGIHKGETVGLVDEADQAHLLVRSASGREFAVPKSQVTEVMGQAKLGPEVARYYGATQSFQRPVTYATQEAGIAAGVEYMPFFEAQRVRIEQGFNRISDNWLDAALEGMGKTSTELVPLSLRNNYQDAANRYAWLRALNREISRQIDRPALRTFKAPVAQDARSFFRGAKRAPDEVQALIDRLGDASNLPKMHERHLAYLDIQNELKPLLEQAKGVRQLTYARVSRYRKGITKQPVGGTTEFPREFHGRYYPENVGARFQEEFARPQLGTIEQAVVDVNNTFRAIVASWDLSFLGIQGLIGLGTDPKSYFQVMKNATFFGYDDFIKTAYDSGMLTRFLRAGGHISSDVVGEFMVGRSVTNIPGLGKGFQLSNQWFSRFGNALRLKMFESGLKVGMTEVEMAALARNVNLATGYSASRPSRIENIALFAPKFFRSQLGLLSDSVTKGKGNIAGKRARHQIIALMAEGTLLTLGANALQGRETVLDPRDPNFMRVRAFGRDISLFGPWDTLARAVSYLCTEGPVEGASYIARSKASPAVARVYDTIAGQTFKGQKIDFRGGPVEIAQSIVALGSQMLPISVQQSFVEQGLPETPGQVAGAFTEFLGTKATPLTGWERLAEARDDHARQDYGQAWDELGPKAHWTLEQKYPDELKRPEATTDVGKYLEARRNIGDKYFNYLQELEKRVDSGELTLPQWREQYIEMQKIKAGEYKGLDSASTEATSKLDRKPENSNMEALAQHSQAFREAVTPWGTLSPEKLDQNLSKLEASWTSAQKAFVEENTGYKNTPTLARYRAAQKKLEPYWDVDDEVWQEFRSRYSDLKQYNSADDYGHALQQQLISLGMPSEQAAYQLQQSQILKAFEKVKASRRRVLRAKNPEIDQLLYQFYGYTPLAYQQPTGQITTGISSLRSVTLRR